MYSHNILFLFFRAFIEGHAAVFYGLTYPVNYVPRKRAIAYSVQLPSPLISIKYSFKPFPNHSNKNNIYGI